MKIKLVEIHKEYDPKEWKDTHIYNFDADIEVDGVFKEIAAVTAFGPKNSDAFKSKQEMEGKEREYKGEIEYTVSMPRSGGGGAPRGKSPEERQSIVRQCAFKGAIDLIVAGKIEMKELPEFINRAEKAIAG